jgi:hypothetical protein
LSTILGCSSPAGIISGKALLQGESDNSGILVTLSGPSAASAVTSSAGDFRFSGLRRGDYVVIASAPSTREPTLVASVPLASGAATLPDLTFTPVGALTGNVTLGAANGNAGITVVAVGSSSIAITDDAGNYTLSGLVTGPHDLIASQNGYVSALAGAVPVEYGKTNTVPRLRLDRIPTPVAAGRIDGKIAITGVSDVHGVAVSLVGPVSSAAVTGLDGAYGFSGLVDGTYTITAAASSTAEQSETQTVEVAGGATVSAPLLTFTPLGSLSGKATLAGAGTGNSGILVFATGASLAAFTTDGGDYVLNGLPAGTYSVQAVKTGFNVASVANQTVEYALPHSVPQLDLSPAPSEQSTTIAGIATLIGRAAHDGTTVSVSGTIATAATLTDGSYMLDGIPQGVYSLAFQNGSYQELVPTVLAMAPGNGYVVDGSLYPLSTLELPRGHRLLSSSNVWPNRLSADGTHLIYSSDFTYYTGKLWVSSISGGSPKQVSTVGAGFSAKFTPDASTVLYLSDVDSAVNPLVGSLHVQVLSSGVDTTIASGVDRFDVSSDGAYVLLHRLFTSEAQLVSLPGGTTTTVGGDYCGFSPDSKNILVETATGLRIIPLSGAPPTNLNWTGSCGTWTPDGQQILVIDNNGLHRVSMSGGSSTLIDSSVNLGGLTFSPDGSRFVYFYQPNGGNSATVRSALSSGDTATTIASNVNLFDSWGFSPDSHHFVYCLADSTIQAWSAADGAVTLATPTISNLDFDGFAISPDSANVMFQTDAQLYVTPIAGGAYTALGAVVGSGGTGYREFDFSGDGQQAVFLRGSDVVVEPITSGSVTTIGSDVGIRRHGMSPDGTKVWMLSGVLSPNTLEVGYVSGAPPVPLLNDVSANTLGILWAGNDAVVAVRINSPPPYRFQDGIYALEVP